MAEITQEKANEYMQVAALLASDIEVLLETITGGDLTADQMRDQIKLLHKDMVETTQNPDVRRERWDAYTALLGGLWGFVPDGGTAK